MLKVNRYLGIPGTEWEDIWGNYSGTPAGADNGKIMTLYN